MGEWCTVCGTRHGRAHRCPGEVTPTGPERQAWKVTAETPRGVEGYGVLLAEVGSRWRARILTFPNVLWTVPGGGPGSIKFLGPTPEQAERQAVDFIREHCALRGFRLRDELESFDRPITVLGDGSLVSPRFTRILPVRFGPAAPRTLGRTGNLSETGLFINTEEPLVPGALAGLLLELEHCKLPLRGSVVWNREAPGRFGPAGMGVKLHGAPETYRRYVQALSIPDFG
jgi:hypothetical protein